MGLREYTHKRNFRTTPEPAAKLGPKAPRGLRFVIQKHAATHLHYDFRLELDRVLKSWAVPKGPSLNPDDKRLAMQVEDHPVEYGDFEGVIPKGQYGGGTVMVWDAGTWRPLDENPAQALHKGRISFELRGKKLRGAWSLVRAGGRDPGDRGNRWLLFKRDDQAARRSGPPVTESEPLSVQTGRSVEEIAGDPGSRVHQSNRAARATTTRPLPGAPKQSKRTKSVSIGAAALSGARKAPMAKAYKPQLCTLVKTAPAGDGWAHEVKFDGYRILAHKSGSDVRLLSRRSLDWTAAFEPIATAVGAVPVDDLVLDGEVVVLDAKGRSSFQSLQQAIKERRFARLVYYTFDVLYAEGYDLTGAELLDRKTLLNRIIRSAGPSRLIFSDHVVGGGSKVKTEACRLGLEGVVSKRIDGRYIQQRSTTWVKTKCGHRQEFIVVGYTDPEGARNHFGSLVLAAHDSKGNLVHTGRVGTGFDEKLLRDISRRWTAGKRSPLDKQPPRDQVRGVHWLKPELVAEIAFTEWTDDGRLRHPSFQGLREDKPPAEVKIEKVGSADTERELPETRSKGGAIAPRRTAVVARSSNDPVIGGVAITHPDRVIYPEIGLTKLDLVRYHEQVSEFSLPYLVNRPLSTLRCPTGWKGERFFQKHMRETFSAPVIPLRVKEKDGYEDLISIDSQAGLIKLVQLGVLEIHPWGSRKDEIEHPDWLTFDLDPGEDVELRRVKEASRRIREILLAVKVESFLKTSGGKGLHVVAPLVPRATWDEVKAFTGAVAQYMDADQPSRYVSIMTKSRRTGRIFIDYLRNGRGATSVAPYSPRARAGAPVSMPIDWEDLGRLKSPAQYTVRNAISHIGKRRGDPWDRFFNLRQMLPRGTPSLKKDR